MQKFIKTVSLLLLLAFVLTGCSMPTLDDLYCIPKRFHSDSKLQEVIDDAMEGLQFSAPISGINQQTVQLADLDGDGKDEYLLFARDSSEKPLKILIFTEVAVGYVLMETIEGYGFAFEFVEYANVDDRPGLEIIVGRQVSDQVVRSVSVYRFSSGSSRQLMSATYSRMVTEDFDGNGREDLLLIYPGQTEDSPAVAALYSFRDDQVRRSMEMNLSAPAESLRRVSLSQLMDGTSAVFASYALDENVLVTDVFTAVDDQISPVLMNFKTDTLRNYYVYPEDIDGDGVMDLPALEAMRVPDGVQEQHLIQWFSADAKGTLSKAYTTYHNYEEGWYLMLDGSLADGILLVQAEDVYSFYRWIEGKPQPKELFRIMILSGADREEIAKQDGYYLLYRAETEIYVLKLEEDSLLDAKELVACFRLIRMDWNNEENREEDDEKGFDLGR